MAFCIEIKKVSEDDIDARYRFYSDGDEGEYILNKSTFDVNIIKEMESDKKGMITQRAIMKIIRIIRAGEACPDETMWAS